MNVPSEVHNPHHARRWLILGVIAMAQLMVVLDATVVNIALPSAQRDVGFSDDARQWIITAYALAFGSLLLLRDRTRGGAYLGMGLAAIAMFAAFLFLTYYLQRTKGFSPIQTGLAFLPMTAAIMATAAAANLVLLRRAGPRALQTLGLLLGAGGM